MRWLFVRHAQSEANALGLLQGRGDAALSPAGRLQAQTLREEIAGENIDRVLCSPALRATQTLAELHLTAPALMLPELLERDHGVWEGRSRASLRGTKMWDQAMLTWRGCPTGGERLVDVALRATSAIAALPHSATTLVLSHAGVLRVLLGLIDDTPRPHIGRLRVPSATILQRELPADQWAVLRASLRPAPGDPNECLE